MPPSKNPYLVLGIPINASVDEIKLAYKRMALIWHPDRHHQDKEKATARFVEINNAYKELVHEPQASHDPTEGIDASERSRHPSRATQPPPPSSAKSSTSSLDSYIHVYTSSVTSLRQTTPASSYQASIHSSRKQEPQRGSHAIPNVHRDQTNSPLPASSGFTSTKKSQPLYNPSSSTEYHQFSYHTRRPTFTPSPHPDFDSFSPKKPPTPHEYQRSSPSKYDTTKPARSKWSLYTAPASRKDHIIDPLIKENSKPIRKSNQGSLPLNKSPGLYTNTNIPPIHQPTYNLQLKSFGLGKSGEWIYSLPLTLDELFTGKHFRFAITRHLISHKTKNVILEIDIPPGCRSGTKIRCRGVGHEMKDGSLQNIIFIIEEAPHERFNRLLDDLIVDIRVPWDNALQQGVGEVPIDGLDRQRHSIYINYPRDRTLRGTSVIKGAGMPIRDSGRIIGRGNLVIQWEILPPKTKVLNFMRRFWNPISR